MALALADSFRRPLRALALAAVLGGAGLAQAGPPQDGLDAQSVAQWLDRVHAAPRRHSYIGTVVVTSSAGAMSSARVWHAAGNPQLERVDTLSGPARSSVWGEDTVATLLPADKLLRIETHQAATRFPDLLRSAESSVPEYYTVRPVGDDRVAGFDADVVLLVPRDALRFGYRVWTEQGSGLVLKLQTLGPDAHVLEQTAFSELQLDAPVRADKLRRMMAPPPGWRVERSAAVKTSAAAEGWNLKPAAPGFHLVDCYRRASGQGAMHCVFSDGLASVSLFVEPAQERARMHEGALSSGATHTFTQRRPGWWVTVVGEVPEQTLRAFAQSLARQQP